VQHLPLPLEIRADGTAEVNYAATYYPSALDHKSAARVEVAPAAEVTGIDIKLVRTRITHVTGKVIGAPPGGRAPSHDFHSAHKFRSAGSRRRHV
jgi:hypothetical protein